MDTTYSLLSSLKGRQRQMDSVSNNLANVNTPGYKEDEVMFKEYFNSSIGQDLESEEENFVHHEFISPANRGGASFVMHDEVAQKMGQGKFEYTGNDLDLAIQTKGFFVVQTPHGERYTRNGQFIRDPQGFLANSNGHRLQGKEGPIQLNGKDFSVGTDGTVLVDNKKVAQMQIVDFQNPETLSRMGKSYWAPSTPDQKPIQLDDVIVKQGVIEGSNVDTVKEMVKMISVNRSFEASQKALRAIDELDDKAVSIARV